MVSKNSRLFVMGVSISSLVLSSRDNSASELARLGISPKKQKLDTGLNGETNELEGIFLSKYDCNTFTRMPICLYSFSIKKCARKSCSRAQFF